ncbi:peptidase M3 [Marmoricola sp. Leaf446]|uniref:M3 family metallopeptidase n=1 Tax=Marmoricola sp. Leaf446 TaxID=1736379 RepID=UPI0006FD01B4|nr:M3 family metallopeptidase [Marmoricola sp. Leaf446]KQT91575.1 peptidase M3 [Marmoricola sp. Leaf446]
MDLQPLALPATDGDWLPWTDARVEQGVAAAEAGLADLRAAAPGDPVALTRWNDVEIALSQVLSLVSLLGAVHPDGAVREAAEAHDLATRRLATDVYLDAEVHARLAALDAKALDPPAQRVLADALRAFRRAGVDRDDATRARVRELDRRAQELGQAFSRAIRDDRRTTRVPAASLAGLPEDWLAAHPSDADGTVEVSTDYPDTLPVLTHARDAEARRAVARTMHDVAWPENDAVLAELLTTRRERATLLGHADWPSYDAELKMIGEGDRIPEFVDRVAEAADGPGRRDLADLLEVARAAGEDVVDFSSWRHHLETLRRERFDVDTQEVRRYLDAGKVRAGLLEVTGRLFGLRYEPVDAPTWHPEVTSHDVHLEDGTLLGRVHLDLHPRPHKYHHAAQFSLVPGVRDRLLPEGVLVCNFSRGLMELDHVVTLFHEFGHLLHHVLAGRHDWVRFSGVATEWDFVEAPSQLLEEWAWDAGVLASFATDEHGTPIPAELVGRMRAAQELGTAFLARTQTAYAAVSYAFHQECPPDLTARLRELMARYSLVELVPDTHFHTGFGHLEGYTSAYYTYLWSKVIAKDLFSAFDADDLFAPEVARRYRDTVLAAGGSRDAADLVEDFLGRPYDDRAFSAWLDHRGEEHP